MHNDNPLISSFKGDILYNAKLLNQEFSLLVILLSNLYFCLLVRKISLIIGWSIDSQSHDTLQSNPLAPPLS